MKQITFYANEQELEDFEYVKTRLERNTYADTVRAMISYCKKNLPKNIDIAIKNSRPEPSNAH